MLLDCEPGGNRKLNACVYLLGVGIEQAMHKDHVVDESFVYLRISACFRAEALEPRK